MVQGDLPAPQLPPCLLSHRQLNAQAKGLMKVWPKPEAGGAMLGQGPHKCCHNPEQDIAVMSRVVRGRQLPFQVPQPQQLHLNAGGTVGRTP